MTSCLLMKTPTHLKLRTKWILNGQFTIHKLTIVTVNSSSKAINRIELYSIHNVKNHRIK